MKKRIPCPKCGSKSRASIIRKYFEERGGKKIKNAWKEWRCGRCGWLFYVKDVPFDMKIKPEDLTKKFDEYLKATREYFKKISGIFPLF